MNSINRYRQMTMNRKQIAAVMIVATGVIQTGCATQTATEANFGDAVREVTMNQTYDLGATIYSESEAVVGGDPYHLENVINVFRERSSKPQRVESKVRVGVGSGNR